MDDEKIWQEFIAAIDFAADRAESHAALFLQLWRGSRWKEIQELFPEFKGPFPKPAPEQNDLVMVSDCGREWNYAYFSHVKHKKYHVYSYGRTQYTTTWINGEPDTTPWIFCRHPTEDEINNYKRAYK